MSCIQTLSVVVPFDFSDESFGAIGVALKLVERPSDVHVIHVLPFLSAADPGVIWDTIDDESRTKHLKEAMTKRFAAPEFDGIQLQVAFGDPGTEITDFAESMGAELVVIPSHGRTGLTRLLMGSVVERVVRLAHCPVLALRK